MQQGKTEGLGVAASPPGHSDEPASSLAAGAGSVPNALDFDRAYEAAATPEQELSLDWIVLGVDRKGEAYVMDADSDFYKVDLLPEFWACDNGIEYPEGMATGLYLMTNVVITPDSYGDPTFKGKIEPIALAAQAIEARSGQTEGLDPQGESAVRQDAPNPQGQTPSSENPHHD